MPPIVPDEFPLDNDLLYLNHAAVGVWPKRTRDAVKAFADENMYRGAADYPVWMKTERALRGRLKRLLNAASSDDIALVKNTSEALSLIAYGLDWKPGDNIVSTNQEFPSNRIVWESLHGVGVELRLADVSANDNPEAAMMARCDEHTRLITVSSVQYGSGLRMDLNCLGAFCRDHQILFCIDAIQSLGALAFDARACQADFVVADGHKWMLGPEGLAVFYTHPESRNLLKLHQYGWHMVERAGDFDALEWSVAGSARRFEPGSPNMLGICALNASLSLFEDVGMVEVEKALLENARLVMAWVESEPQLELISPDQEGRFAGIVTFRNVDLDKAGHAALYRKLMASGVICANRAGGIRFSPHFYSDLSAIASLNFNIVNSEGNPQ
ncbi:aminotransferase class V-fold PLP-dependent enzyme [Mariprofundus sp. EBB-1]|uniref:aminotransferase class V-fold PLP-dependent enzyme n=1 Tax=Mariprofundus sp. EBB-1 TaxID=2650971 RepID=UPI000EF225D9|nr:aminotransferase class V-fold PLP-dependent enzyme [Mariprofundus sp. EBB-1]RLL53303.1 aminotransferase class V-fold PLP-dependent enzyme [Mariprofundus sp. EBB-1]